MNDLTEKFFNEEDIPYGFYYLKLKIGEVVIDEYPEVIRDAYGEFERFGFRDNYDDNIAEVLAPVPSYEELQALKDRVNCQKNRIACLEYDLNRCNRLLKQWEEINRHMMQCHGYINHSDFHPTIRETIEWVKEMGEINND